MEKRKKFYNKAKPVHKLYFEEFQQELTDFDKKLELLKQEILKLKGEYLNIKTADYQVK